MPCDRFKLIYIFCKHWISMPVIMHFTLLFSPKRKSLIFILLAPKCSALIYLFTAIYFHKMVPMVRLLIYCSVCFILPIITLVFATLAFKFSFWVLHSAQLSIEFHPTSSHLSQWISMGIEIPYFSIGKRGKKKGNSDSKKYEPTSLPKLEGLHPGSRPDIYSPSFSCVAAPVTYRLHVSVDFLI